MELRLAVCIFICLPWITSATQYYVQVKTGYSTTAGTNAIASIKLFGTKGSSVKTPLIDHNIKLNLFEPGHTSHFILITPTSLGSLTNITVEYNSNLPSDDWLLNNIVVWVVSFPWPKFYFDCYQLLSPRENQSLAIRTLPALKVDAPTKDYVVKVFTGIQYDYYWRRLQTGTDSHVYISIGGKNGRTPKVELKDSTTDTFERGNTDTFVIKAVDLGELEWLTVERDDSLRGWYLEKVFVESKVSHYSQKVKRFTFECNCWLKDKILSTNLTSPLQYNVWQPKGSGSDSGSRSGSGYSTASKAGIGAGGSIGFIILLFICGRYRKAIMCLFGM